MKMMKILFFIGCLVSLCTLACDDHSLACLSATYYPPSTPFPQSNSNLVGESVQTAISSYTRIGNLLDQAAAERSNRYSPSAPPTGYSPEQIQQFQKDHQKNIQRENERFQKKVAETLAVPQDLKDSFRDITNRQQAILETLRNIKIPKIQIPAPHPTQSEPTPQKDTLSTHPLSQEGKELRRVLNRALILDALEHREFMINSVRKADLLFTNPDPNSPQAAKRWLKRAESAYAYWTEQPEKARLSTELLNAGAKEAFGLEDISADTFERYEIIRAAKLLSFEPKLMQNDDLRLQASFALKQALIYAHDGETDLVIQMTENVYAIKDFLKGFGTGIKQNIYDTATGLWHTVTHPVDSVEALSNAVIHYRDTYDIISKQVHKIIEEYPTLTSEQKGNLFGKIASEITTVFLPAGALKNISKAFKLEKAIEHVTEGIASRHAGNIAEARKLADQLRFDEARSIFTKDGRLVDEIVISSKNCIIRPENLGNPKIPAGFGKYATEEFQSPSGLFKVHFYKNSENVVYYDLDYKVVFNVPFGNR